MSDADVKVIDLIFGPRRGIRAHLPHTQCLGHEA
jgi:hypothetical protein